MSRIQIVPGLSAPFYPMRPYRGTPLVPATLPAVLIKMKTHTVQRKLNGDRALLTVLDDKVRVFNRHMTAYSHTVLNGSDFLKIGGPTVLDGEVWKSRFYPFECVVFKGLSLVEYGPNYRESCAKQICERLSLPWMFEVTESWLKSEIQCKHDLKSQWEGVVVKLANSRYQVLGSESQTSETWCKMKFAGLS